jgi:hypothetical protein
VSSQAQRVWAAAGRGEAIRSSVARIWPELAAALEGTAAAGGTSPEEETPEQPRCRLCRRGPGRYALAVGLLGEQPLCGLCAGQLSPSGQRAFELVEDWKAGVVKEDRE